MSKEYVLSNDVHLNIESEESKRELLDFLNSGAEILRCIYDGNIEEAQWKVDNTEDIEEIKRLSGFEFLANTVFVNATIYLDEKDNAETIYLYLVPWIKDDKSSYFDTTVWITPKNRKSTMYKEGQEKASAIITFVKQRYHQYKDDLVKLLG